MIPRARAPSGLAGTGGRPSRRRCGLRALVYLSALAANTGTAAADPLAETLADPAFTAAYRSYFEALSGYGPEDLEVELAETIEDALTAGSHLSRPSIDPKRRQIESALLHQARGELCGPAPPPERVQAACVGATLSATGQAGIRPGADLVGTISAVCARMAGEPGRTQWCHGR